MSASNMQPAPTAGFPGATPPDVYVVASHAAARRLVEQARAAGFVTGWIDGSAVNSKAAFLAAAARDLHFPDYFGHNWDAFNDCFRDLGYLPGSGAVIVIDRFGRFAGRQPEEWEVALAVMRGAAEDSRHEGHPIFVLLRGPVGAAAGISRL